MLKYTGAVARYPARALFVAYLLAIIVGGLLLYTPLARQYPDSEQRPHITLVDSFFTAASAVCVTGLSVRPTGTYFSSFGHVVILLLIQMGGVGIMTLTTYITRVLGANEDLRARQALSETLGATTTEGVRWVGRRVLGVTLIIESIGALLLLPSFWRDKSFGEACWWAVFHAVSAFCNAGFSLHDQNLVPWRTDVLLNFTIMGLIVLGGIGFPILADVSRSLARYAREPNRPLVRIWSGLLLSTKLMLVGTVVLIVFGTVAIARLEWNRTLGDLEWPHKILAALFASVTPRTAGFNTLDYGKMATATLFVTLLLMLIGGGPASTAGGTKVSTFMVLVARVRARFRGRPHVTAFGRTIPRETIDRAFVIVLLFGGLTIVGTLGVLVLGETVFFTRSDSDHGKFLSVCFEVVSALCTVGLSIGITADLTDFSKVVLIALMFAGRLGPVALYAALSREEQVMKARPVREDVLVG
jgi:trk system potassium uptake protein TrkH